MELFPTPTTNTRLGFHYFPDTLHYRESDLNAWLPELHALGASWLTLVAPYDRAIPELFLRGLLSAGIEPILHFHLPLNLPPKINDLRLLFHTYARWGVHYVVLFDRPNARISWPATAWAQSNLVERFLDVYIPLAQAALQAGLVPVFPPLEPGGDYWDTAFLKAALQGIQRRGQHQLLKRLALGAYAVPGNRCLNWGAGGPERWPSARPYHTPLGTEDQRGFRIFDWYLAQVRAVADTPCAILLMGSGCRPGDHTDPSIPPIDLAAHAKTNLSIAALMIGQKPERIKHKSEMEDLEPVPSNVLVCNFYLLAASQDSSSTREAWFQTDAQTLPVVGALRQWVANLETELDHGLREGHVYSAHGISAPAPNGSVHQNRSDHPIRHYLLLPTYEWGIADWHLEVIRPFVKKYRPTIGFSLKEASQAARVTLIGGSQSFPDNVLNDLRSSNCIVEQISGDGTSIASQLAAL